MDMSYVIARHEEDDSVSNPFNQSINLLKDSSIDNAYEVAEHAEVE